MKTHIFDEVSLNKKDREKIRLKKRKKTVKHWYWENWGTIYWANISREMKNYLDSKKKQKKK